MKYGRSVKNYDGEQIVGLGKVIIYL